MDGYFIFRYLRPGEVPNENPENINEIDPALLFKVYVNPIYLNLQQNQSF